MCQDDTDYRIERLNNMKPLHHCFEMESKDGGIQVTKLIAISRIIDFYRRRSD